MANERSPRHHRQQQPSFVDDFYQENSFVEYHGHGRDQGQQGYLGQHSAAADYIFGGNGDQQQYVLGGQNKRDILSQKSMERTLTSQVCKNPFLANQMNNYVQDIEVQDRFLKPMNASFMR